MFIVYDDLLKVVELLEFKENIFIWRYGVLENVILSFLELNKIIGEKVGLEGKKLNIKNFKDKLME